MKMDYTPTPAEETVAAHMDALIENLLDGNLLAVGVCAVRVDGEPAFFYLNKPDQPVLRPALNRLLGLYEAGRIFKDRMNAPPANRSYRTH